MGVSTAAVITSESRILFVRRPPGGDLGECWELPGGKVDPGESPEVGLRRELGEELGVDARVHGPVGRSEFHHQGERFELKAYRVSIDTENVTLREHTAMAWCTREEAVKLRLAPSDRSLLQSLDWGAVFSG